jgi:hypothetical protein
MIPENTEQGTDVWCVLVVCCEPWTYAHILKREVAFSGPKKVVVSDSDQNIEIYESYRVFLTKQEAEYHAVGVLGDLMGHMKRQIEEIKTGKKLTNIVLDLGSLKYEIPITEE